MSSKMLGQQKIDDLYIYIYIFTYIYIYIYVYIYMYMMISNYSLVDDSLRGIELYFRELINQLIVEESPLTENCGASVPPLSGFLSHRATLW